MRKFDILANPDNLRGYRVKLYPTEEQKVLLNRQIELFRYFYNWALNKEIENYKAFCKGEAEKTFLQEKDLYELYTEERKEKDWFKELPSHSVRESLRNLLRAYDYFFKKTHRFPRFKSKRKAKRILQFRNESYAFFFKGEYVRIPGLKLRDKILCKSHKVPVGDDVRYYRGTITFDGYNYWLSFYAEVDRSYLLEHEPTGYEDESVGIDLGFHKLAQLSTGQTYYHPDVHVLYNRMRKQQSRLRKMRNARLKKAQQATSKLDEIPMSNNELKLQYQYYKTRTRITNIQRYNYHKVTTEIANMYPKRIVIEDLDFSEMRRKSNPSRRYLKKTPIHLFKEYLQYKCKDRGVELVIADHWFPSTKTCSNCGSKYDLEGSRTYHCPVCGFTMDRDMNAAINLSRYMG